MNIAMIGHGMMGAWHSDALKACRGVTLHTLVGRRPEADSRVRRPQRLSQIDHRARRGAGRSRGRGGHRRQPQRAARGARDQVLGCRQARAARNPDRHVPGRRRARRRRRRALGRNAGPCATRCAFAASARLCAPLRIRRGDPPPHGWPLLHPSPEEYRCNRLPAQLDRQHPLASLLPFRRPRHVPARRAAVRRVQTIYGGRATPSPASRWNASCWSRPRRTRRCWCMARTTPASGLRQGDRHRPRDLHVRHSRRARCDPPRARSRSRTRRRIARGSPAISSRGRRRAARIATAARSCRRCGCCSRSRTRGILGTAPARSRGGR